MSAARAAEAELNKNKPVRVVSAVGKTEPYEICEITGERIPVAAVSMRNKDLQCWRCGGKGHFAANCATPGDGAARGGRGRGNGPRNRSRGGRGGRGKRGGQGGWSPMKQVNAVDQDKANPPPDESEAELENWDEEASQGNEFGE